MSLNSMLRPVHTIRCLLAGFSNSVSRNCQSCSEPRRWYGKPSCLTLPAGSHKIYQHLHLLPLNLLLHGREQQKQIRVDQWGGKKLFLCVIREKILVYNLKFYILLQAMMIHCLYCHLLTELVLQPLTNLHPIFLNFHKTCERWKPCY